MSNKRDHFSCFDSNEVNKSSGQMEVISSLKDLKIPPKFIFILIFEPFTPFISLPFLRFFLSPHFLFFFPPYHSRHPTTEGLRHHSPIPFSFYFMFFYIHCYSFTIRTVPPPSFHPTKWVKWYPGKKVTGEAPIREDQCDIYHSRAL